MPTLNGTSGNDSIDGRGQTEALIINGRAADDTIWGGSASDRLSGGAGSDYIYASPLDALVDGGAGKDTLDFSLYVADSSGQGVNARLFGGDLGLWPDQNGSEVFITGQIKNIENLVGSNYNDALMGNRAVNVINGGGGNDWVIAWGSGDFLIGGSGADKFALDNAGAKSTVIDFNYAAGDRLYFDVAPEISWAAGSGLDANGVSHSAWIGTYEDRFGNVEQIILLDVTTQPNADWVTSLA